MTFAQQSGLKLDEQSGVIYGNYQGYDITILPTGGGKTFQLSFSVKRGEEAPNITEMQKLTRLYKSLFLGAVTDRYSVSFNIKSAGFGASATVNKKLIPALSAAVTFLRSENYTNCCAGCGKTGVNGSYYIYNSPSVLATHALKPFRTGTTRLAETRNKRAKILSAESIGAAICPTLYCFMRLRRSARFPPFQIRLKNTKASARFTEWVLTQCKARKI